MARHDRQTGPHRHHGRHRDRTRPGGRPLGDDADRRRAHADELGWFSTRSYLILRTPQAPRSWVRALPRFPVSYHPEVLLWSQEIAPDGHVLPWVLRADETYDPDHDVEAGWQVWKHPEPDGH